jgi:deoxyribodipyrimidine photo-lyase
MKPYPTEKYFHNFLKTKPLPVPSLAGIGFQPNPVAFPPDMVSQGLIRHYAETRNFPGVEGTSRLGIHFRFGTISIREKALKALKISPVYLNELIWRDFYSMILHHFPHVVGKPFRPEYEAVEWRNDPVEFQRWCDGTTGYPIVDAGMRELNATGYMHNRVRMIVASFLTKHLLIDWRWGEAYFAKKLLDFDLASNNGGWQWAAGCGTDAAPYFRIFNPEAQTEKFDKDLKYVKKWAPEFGSKNYPKPIVEHKMARERCLAAYKKALAMR